ncbi:MAG: helix-turn-helix domain-containing protein [Acidobacteria bacterium]|nr:helix-turn-helix domain-containing protein [Acidobacteriota bacterium]
MRRLSELEKAEIWDRFEAGESQRSISRRLGRSPSSIRTHLRSRRLAALLVVSGESSGQTMVVQPASPDLCWADGSVDVALDYHETDLTSCWKLLEFHLRLRIPSPCSRSAHR